MRNGKHVILYVDDDQDFLDAMRVQLESRGFVMVEATSAEDGLRAFRREQPDLVLVDLMMEEVDAGTQFVREIRSEARAGGRPVPVVMVSSVGDNLSLTADYSELGLAAIFQKPVDPETLVGVVKAKLR